MRFTRKPAIVFGAYSVPKSRLTICRMAALGALSQAWASAEAALPLGWRTSGSWRFGELWVALAEGPEWDDYLSGTGQHADQAMSRLSDALRERRGPTTR
jgi:hypothetical protein